MGNRRTRRPVTGMDQPLPWDEHGGSADAPRDDDGTEARPSDEVPEPEAVAMPRAQRPRRPSPPLTAEQRILRARLAAYRLHATHDPKETTRSARAAFASRFEREVDPEGVLDPAERARRAEAARKAHFTRLALRSSRARRRPA